jgi:hypothetical protein
MIEHHLVKHYQNIVMFCMSLFVFGMAFFGGANTRKSLLRKFSRITNRSTENTTISVPSSTTGLPFAITSAPYHPPFPAANTPKLPAEFSDIPESAVSCWDALANYSTVKRFLSSELRKSSSFSFITLNTTSYSTDVWTDIGERICTTTFIPSLTTLCDGYPRASTVTSNCQTQWATNTVTWTLTDTFIDYPPAWATETDQLQYPTCTVATNFEQCSRLSDAYNWRTTHLQMQTPSPTGSIAPPSCSILNRPVSSAKPACFLEGGSWQAYYWHSPIPTGSAFCNRNGTNYTATATIPGRANTAVISGLIMTSPSVYYLLRNATLQTFAGQASFIGDTSTGQDAFFPSTTLAVLTAAQRESNILTVSAACTGSGKRRHCTYHVLPHFSIADLATVRADEYCSAKTPTCRGGETIYQDDYGPTLAIPMTAIVAQNGVFSDCAWTTSNSRVKTAGPPVYRAGVMKSTDWIKIPLTSLPTNDVLETAVP